MSPNPYSLFEPGEIKNKSNKEVSSGLESKGIEIIKDRSVVLRALRPNKQIKRQNSEFIKFREFENTSADNSIINMEKSLLLTKKDSSKIKIVGF